jgi:hypothetical protein
MNRARFAVAATVIGTTLLAGAVLAQSQAPPMKSVLAGKKFVPPAKGQVEIEFTQPVTKRDKDMVVTTITVKNIHVSAPIARLVIDETWYGKDGSVVTRGRGVINGLLGPGEVQTVTIQTPYKAGMNANNWNFNHANGTIKPKKVAKLEVPKEPAAANASTTKKP